MIMREPELNLTIATSDETCLTRPQLLCVKSTPSCCMIQRSRTSVSLSIGTNLCLARLRLMLMMRGEAVSALDEHSSGGQRLSWA